MSPTDEPCRRDDGVDGSPARPSIDAVARHRTLRHAPLLDEAGLNPRYTFETFVKGASNQFALAAALRVAETPARSYNPLFIYGAAGLGKTHLLHAIGHYVDQNYQHYQVRYVSHRDVPERVRRRHPHQHDRATFKRRYREIDVLLIDDIQFMEGKEGLQEEFFHTFNSLHGANKQIVISSDRMPDAIPTLEERLRGRFKWGLITDIQPPDLETRLAILRNKAERDHSRGAARRRSSSSPPRSPTNIRELEGALIRVTAYASLNHVPITTAAGRAAARRPAAASTDAEPRTDDELLAEIADILGFSVEALQGKSRQRPLVTARQIAHVRVPRAHRPELPGDRPAVRRPRPHHGHPRRREDPAADEGAPAGLRPGHRPDPAAQVMSGRVSTRRTTCGQRCGRPASTPVDNRRSSTERHRRHLGACGTTGDNAGHSDTHCLRCGDDRVVHNPQPLLPLLAVSTHHRWGRGRSVKFRCEREVLGRSPGDRRAGGRRAHRHAPGAVRPAPRARRATSSSVTGTDLELTIQLTIDRRRRARRRASSCRPGSPPTSCARWRRRGRGRRRRRRGRASAPAARSSPCARCRSTTIPRWPSRPPTAVTLPAPTFGEALRQVVRAASTDEARPILTGVLLTAEDDGLRLVATDSYRLAVRDLPEHVGARRGPEGARAVAGRCNELQRAARRRRARSRCASASATRRSRSATTRLTTRLIEGEFPNYRQLHPGSRTRTR